ncbi:uncharacterized protein LOC144141839 [Haemaphysalis longicornis]
MLVTRNMGIQKMFAAVYLFALVGLSASENQTPQLTDCPGEDEEFLKFYGFTIEDATLGGTLRAHTEVSFTKEFTNPTLHIGISRPDGTELPCIKGLWQCDLKLCNGTTPEEKELNADWDNECPIEPGTYTARMSFPLPDTKETRAFFGDGNVVITLIVKDGDETVECVSLPMKVDVD